MAILLSVAGLSKAAECSNADFKGRYANMAQLSIVAEGGGSDNWISGTAVADGAGVITEWKDAVSILPPGAPAQVLVERDIISSGGSGTYEVLADCRMTVQLIDANRPPGDQIIKLTGALAASGREAFLIQADLPAGSQVGGIFKSVEGPTSPEIEQILALLKRLAIRNGLRP